MQATAVLLLGKKKRKKEKERGKKATEKKKAHLSKLKKNTFYHLFLCFPRKAKALHRGTSGCHGRLAVQGLPGSFLPQNMAMLSADGCTGNGSVPLFLPWRSLRWSRGSRFCAPFNRKGFTGV